MGKKEPNRIFVVDDGYEKKLIPAHIDDEGHITITKKQNGK